MTLITLPAYLPQYSLRNGWSRVPVSPHKRTEMDDGEIAVARRFARTRGLEQMTWELDQYQFDIATHFWEVDLNAGGDWFLAPLN